MSPEPGERIVADAPANYDGDQTIYIDPTTVYTATFYYDPSKMTDALPSTVTPAAIVSGVDYGTVPEKLREINDGFQNIYNVWKTLDLSWVGDAATAAQDVQSELDAVQKRLFGDPGATDATTDDTPGVIGEMSSLAAAAAVNYSNVETGNVKMFNELNDAIKYTPLPPEDSTDPAPPYVKPDYSPYDYPFVTEKFA
jgi:hypothetical protein